MKRSLWISAVLLTALFSSSVPAAERSADADLDTRLWRHRNLGKAFYENPATQYEAVGEFRKAAELAPKSARERINLGLALLRAGKEEEGVAELEKAQALDPKIPHTWFNLGIAYKRAGRYADALGQLEGMRQARVPTDSINALQPGGALQARRSAANEAMAATSSAPPSWMRTSPARTSNSPPRILPAGPARRRRPKRSHGDVFRADQAHATKGRRCPKISSGAITPRSTMILEPENARDGAAPAQSRTRLPRIVARDVDPASAGLAVVDLGRRRRRRSPEPGAPASDGVTCAFAPRRPKKRRPVWSSRPRFHSQSGSRVTSDNDGLADLAMVRRATARVADPGTASKEDCFEPRRSELGAGALSMRDLGVARLRPRLRPRPLRPRCANRSPVPQQRRRPDGATRPTDFPFVDGDRRRRRTASTWWQTPRVRGPRRDLRATIAAV